MFWFLFALLSLADVPTTAQVVHVYDGDTVTLDNGDKVRVKWVNAPEKRPPEPFAAEATRLAEKLVLGRKVTLVVDPDNPRDGYGRLIAGVRVGKNDLSLRLIEEGFGHVFLIPPEPEDPTPLLKAQEKARKAKKGIWSTDRYQGELHISSFHARARGNEEYNLNGEYLRVCNITAEPLDVEGFYLTNFDGQRFDFPSLVIPAGHTVLVHTGRGEHQRDPELQLQIFLGQPKPIWHNGYDRARLYNPGGDLIDEVEHGKPERREQAE
ncbi:MAG: hypothetical protein EA397_05075 [Deltaproteobacteria bacterium]|nr:MAG: hypothetical protein EA397_05075 [Deltaproteobacteria bacterium]